MPFQEMTVELQRRQLVSWILNDGMSVSEAARRAGLTRQGVYFWLRRFRQEGPAGLGARSRAPKTRPGRTAPWIEEALVQAKLDNQVWGAKKHLARLWPEEKPPVSLRTADRILKRHGLVKPRNAPKRPLQRFEKDACNELWQMDFKGLAKRFNYQPLSVLDDHSRFGLEFLPMKSRATQDVFEVLWALFGEYGLPEAILCDNGDCWGSGLTMAPTRLEAMLLLLGVNTVHGRPYHPQTQGKVERFHRTAKDELGAALLAPSVEAAKPIYRRFLERYNWDRPHEALGMKTPGSVYRPSSRLRPERMPDQQLDEGSIKRKVDMIGKFSYGGEHYRAGHGLAGYYVEIREDQIGRYAVFANKNIGYLDQMKV